MIRILFVKSGKHADPVTKSRETNKTAIEKVIAGRTLKFLGTELPVIGESSSLSDFAGPDYVVLDLPAGSGVLGADKPGLYVVVGLRPSEVP